MHEKTVKGLLSAGNGMNLYRGCTHGCIYCDSRSLCYRMDHDFEDVEVKVNAPELLEEALRKKRRKCMIGTGAMCDPYLPLEEEIGLTRRCLQIIDRYGFGLAIQTKSARILRDLEILKRINAHSKCVVQMTLTTMDETLCRVLEPNVSATRERVDALKVFRDCGIPTVAWLVPLLPFINDTMENLTGLLSCCREAKVKGILWFGAGVTLREGDREYFYGKLDEHFPGMKARYVRAFGNAYECRSPDSAVLDACLTTFCREHGIMHDAGEVFAYLREYADKAAAGQTRMF